MRNILSRIQDRSLAWITVCTWVVVCAVATPHVCAEKVELEYKPSPIDNPLKGLVPYAGQGETFPNSLEFWYFPIRKLMTGPDQFDWSPVESKLEASRGRGCQMVIRVYLEFPGKRNAMPDFLIDQGVKVTQYESDGKKNRTPDYTDERLISAMERFVAAFGKKYDGDPRLGFVTMGVLGHWGEWHTYPKPELFPDKVIQTRIMKAFEAAFSTTKVLMRYPAGDNDWSYASNHQSPFGYHDDSFCWATLHTGKEGDEWFFEARLMAAGRDALEKWKTQPIGGEIRPEVWGCVFDEKSCAPEGQGFEKCVERTHASWLMDSGMFSDADPPPSKERMRNATKFVRKLGYEIYVRSAEMSVVDGRMSISMDVENKGVAPFYYDWPVEVLVLNKDEESIMSEKTKWKLTEVLPGKAVRWETELAIDASQFANAKIAIRVVQPMRGGKPFRFANETQRENGLLVIR